MRHFAYIINPISGTRSKKDLPDYVATRTREAGFGCTVYSSPRDGDYSAIEKQLMAHETTDIVIAGGDGTINAAVGALRHLGLPFGIIPCGSGNGLAFSAGIPKQPRLALETILSAAPAPVDAYTVNGRFACMLCGLGLDAKVAHDFANAGTRGLMTYIEKSIANFFTAKPHPFTLQVEDTHYPVEAFFISIANSNQFGNNVTIAPKASLSDGLLDVVVLAKQNKFSLVLQAARQCLGFNKPRELTTLTSGTSLLYLQAPSIIIHNPEGAHLHIDGDPVDTAHLLDIQVIPHAFQLLMP
ncbi:diacylglycerol kinase family lipid kinase [Flaviaesturariibacter amylovorans]|uniref:Diacylglycerol kinase family lipid kinase n=2 Tax=Flaviaesturariibacter amylovorans TaxID=1084520 RepID=A0ABP8HVS1_9BACT